MDDDAGCVEHRAQGCRRTRSNGGQQGGFHLAGSELTAPRLLLGLPDEFADNASAQALPGLADGRQGQQIIGPRNQAAGINLVHSPSSFRGVPAGGWRRRTGIEPARPRYSASPVLKTGGPTRTRTPPRSI